MRLHHLGFGLIAVGIASCSSESTGATTGVPPFAVAVANGNNQVSAVGAALVTPLAVVVTDANGAPVVGAQVSWSVTSGGGRVSPSTSTTNGSGRATTIFTLGSTLGSQTAVASAPTAPSSVTFSATAITDQPVPSPVLVASVPTPTGATYDHDTYVRDGLAFAFMWNAGVRIYDVGNGVKNGSPSNPVLVGSLITSASASLVGANSATGVNVHNGWWFHNPVSGENKYLFIGQEGPGSVGSSSSGDIHIVDVSDMTAPVEVGYIHIPGAGPHNFWMDEASQTLYAAYYNAGVVKIDVSGTLSGNMSNRITRQVQPGGAGNTYVWGVMLSNGTLYATDMLSGFWALDPVTLATKGGGNNVPERFGSDQWVYGQYAYSGTWASRATVGNAVKIWVLDETGVPTLADSLIVPGVSTISDVAVTADGKMLVITTEIGPGQGLYVYDRANPLKPVLAGSYLTPQGLHTGEVAVIGGRTYVFCARDPGLPELDIFDITGLAH